MFTFLGLAFVIGMSHALEADHVAAVSAIAAKQTRLSSIIRTGAVWGLGHTLTLAAFAGVTLVLGLAINEQLAGWLELFVGIMLAGLGTHILYRLARDRIHFHMHQHAGKAAHFHAHSHTEHPPHEQATHDHKHKPFPFRSLLVGMMHGMAGSAALLILTASNAPSPGQGLAYVALFGVGSILGMACLSAIIAVPLALSARFLTWANWGLQGSIGLATLVLGLNTIYVVQATL
ncbi:MAG: urease accessory protein [Rhodospirillaceae bacterium]|nr:MAG: urease accessory protein [Rhodospirillaceae bacterium]